MVTASGIGHDHLPALHGSYGTKAGRLPVLDGCSGCSVSPANLFGLGATEDQIQAMADGIIKEAGGLFFVSSTAIKNAMAVLSDEDAQRLGQALIAKGVDASSVESAMSRQFGKAGGTSTIWAVLATASAAASAYHGYKRNRSVGWAIWWFFMGGLFPVVTPVIAVAQGYGKEK